MLDGQNTDAVITWLFEEDRFAPIGRIQGTTRQSILTDQLGTPLAMVDQGGQRSWQAQTTAYGRIRLEEGTRAACPFRFQGQYEDVETGLYYNRFRYYAPEEGAYISQDPIRLTRQICTHTLMIQQIGQICLVCCHVRIKKQHLQDQVGATHSDRQNATLTYRWANNLTK